MVAKGFFKLPNLLMLIKEKNQPLPRNLALAAFGGLLIVFSVKVNLPYLLCSMVCGCCPLDLIKKKLFAKSFSKDSNLDGPR